MRRGVVPEELEILLEKKAANGLQVVTDQVGQLDPLIEYAGALFESRRELR